MDIDSFFHFKLTGYENLRYYLSTFYQRKISKSHAIDIMARHGLATMHNKLFGAYSKVRKVCLAMSFMVVAEWKALFLDEPANGLDIQEIDLLCILLIRMKASITTILIVTHDQKFMQRIADFAVLLQGHSNAVTLAPRWVNQINHFLVDVIYDQGMLINNTWTYEDLYQLLKSGA